MKMKSFNLPAVLLAVITAAAMIFAYGLMTQVHADDGGYSVDVHTFNKHDSYIGLPGSSLGLEATVYYDFEGESFKEDGDLDLRWKLDDEDSQYAKIKVNPVNNHTATLEFKKDLPGGQKEVDTFITVTVTVLSDGKEVASGFVFVIESSDYYLMDPVCFESYLGIGDEEELTASVRHYTTDNPLGEIVKNVKFEWEVDGGAFSGLEAPVSQTEDEAVYKVKRLSPESSILVLHGTWGEGETAGEEYSVLWTDDISTDLNDYKVDLPEGLDWAYFVDEGGYIDREDLNHNTSVYFETKDGVKDPESTVYLEYGKDFDLVIDKYAGYDDNTDEAIWTPYEPDKLVTDERGAHDLNGEPTEGTAIYRVRAVAKGDVLTGATDDYAQYIYMYSNRALTGYSPDFEFDYSYGTYLDEDPWFRYDVSPGTILGPVVKLGEDELDENVHYKTVYVGINVDYEGNEFPEDPGVYEAYIEGIGEYYGTSYSRTIKVGKTNLNFNASGKTVKVKASKKKTTFAAKKAFKVSGNQGKVTYKKTSGNSKITVASNGKVTVKKGLKKGKTYKVKVKVTDNESDKYFAAEKTVTLKVKVTK